MNEDNLEPDIVQEVKPKNEISCCNIALIIAGSICILIGIIDMIVFYAIPYKEIKENKRKYPDYEFEKPNKGLVALHFLEHIFLIFTGVVIILAILPGEFYKTVTYLALIICIPLALGIIFMLNIILSALLLEIIKKEDFTLEQIHNLTNLEHPINSVFIYITGKIRGRKKHYYTCYSDNGVDYPIYSVRTSPDFEIDGKEPDLFYLIVSQKVNMTDDLFLNIEKGKSSIVSCENTFTANSYYDPRFEGKNLISHGQKIQTKLTKKTAVTSIVFGVSIYYELLQKSIPIKRYNQEINAQCLTDVDYDKILTDIDCSVIGTCKRTNDLPHK